MATSGAIQLSTAGITVWHAPETEIGVLPKTGWKKQAEVKSTPSLDASPDSLETTTLEETEYKTYIPGLKDLGGVLEFNANLTQLTIETWDEACDEFDTAKAAGKGQWWCIRVPNLKDSFYFRGEPTRIGLPGAEVSAVLETPLRVTPTAAPERHPRLKVGEDGTSGTVPDDYESLSVASVGGTAVKTSTKNSVTV